MDEPGIRIHPLRKGSAGWCYAAVGIIIWDTIAPDNEKLTHAFRRGLKSRKILVGCSWLYLTAHLFGVIPDQYDLLYIVTAECGRRFDDYQSRQAGSVAA